MALSFGVVVAVNNLIALKGFSVFLNNYGIFEHPTWMERRLTPFIQRWLEDKAKRTFIELKRDMGDISITLNDCDTAMFTVLYLAKYQAPIKTGKELFGLMAETQLEFERLKRPKANEQYRTETPEA